VRVHRGIAALVAALALATPTAALAGFPGTDPDESVRINTPNDPDNDPRVPVAAGNDEADDILDASDLIAVFSDGTDADANGYVDDIAGRVSARAGGVTYRVEWAPGIEPAESEFRPVAAGAGAADGKLATIDLRAMRAALDARPGGGAANDPTAPLREA